MAAAPGVTVLHLGDRDVAADLSTYLTRARALDPEGAARLQASGTTLAVYVGVLPGQGLLGKGTVLGLRVMALREAAEVDATVPVASVADRLARPGSPTDLAVPPVGVSTGWAALTPPRSGWEPVGTLGADDLRAAAAAGIAEVSQGVPAGAGAHAVRSLRQQVWGRETATVPPVPAGAAFAAYSLGFLTDDPVAVLACGRWTRLTSATGHVLLR